jgi:hypothetical protein
MRRRAIVVVVIFVIAFSAALFLVPPIPVTEHFPPALGPGGGVSVSFTYYESVSVYYLKVGAIYVDGCVTGAAYRLVDFRMAVSLC